MAKRPRKKTGEPCEHQWVHKLSKRKPGSWVKHCRKCGVQITPDRGRVYPSMLR